MRSIFRSVLIIPSLLPTLAFVALTNHDSQYSHSISPSYSITAECFSRIRPCCQMARKSSAKDIKSFDNKKRKRQRTRRKWDSMLPRLQAFRKKHGHSMVTDTDDDFELYEWTRKLRYTYVHQIRNTTSSTSDRRFLSEDQLQSLRDLEFDWEVTKRKRRWHIMIKRLTDFQTEHGHTRIEESNEDYELFEWVKFIRYTYKHQILNTTVTKKNRPRLSEIKMKELQKLDFDWTPTRKIKRWDVMLPKLEAFKEMHGHCMVSPAEDLELYQWAKSIRSNYRHQLTNNTLGTNNTLEVNASSLSRRPRLSNEKLATLERLGFCWETRSSMWDRRYQELCEFHKLNGHCHVSIRENPQLGGFVQRQRQEFKRYNAGNATSMTSERIDLLSRIDFEWARSHELAWEERRSDLEGYLQRAGNSSVPQNYTASYQLGQWCMNQRTKFRLNQAGEKSGLTPDRIRKLEKLEFAWNIPEAKWKTMFGRLKMFYEENEHLEIPVSDSENNDLRQWLNIQRHLYRSNQTSRLNSERIELMESIPDFSWNRRRGGGPSKDDWSNLFVAIREKGIGPGGKTKEHWFDGVNRFKQEVKTEYSEQELLALWNEENEDDDEEDDFIVDDESSTSFLRA